METAPRNINSPSTEKISFDQIQLFREQNRFTEAEIAKLESGESTIFQLEQQLQAEKLKAEEQIIEFMQLNKNNPIDHYTIAFKTQLNTETSPSRLALLTEQIRVQNEQLEALNQAQDKVSNNPAIEATYREIYNKITSADAKKWIGEKQVRSFLNFYKNAFKYQITTPEQAASMMEAMENSNDGLKPRQEFYQNILEPKLQDYGLGIEKTNLLRNEGLSERTKALQLINQTEDILDDSVRNNFMIGAVKREYIKKMLQASSLSEIEAMQRDAQECNRLEKKTHGRNIMDQEIRIGSQTVHLFSKDDRQTIKQFHQNENDLKKKQTYLEWLPDMEKKAKAQFQELATIFKDTPKDLSNVLLEFTNSQYHKRKDLLDKYRNDQLEKTGKLDKEINRLENVAISAIEKAKAQNIISNETYREFITYAKNKQQFQNPQTGKLDLSKYQDFIAKMTSDTPIFDRSNRNLKAYAVRRENFLKTLDRYQQINPDFNSSEYKQKLESYNSKTYSGRKAQYLNLKEEIATFERNQETKQQHHRQLSTLVDRAIFQENFEQNPDDFEKKTWERIYKNLKNSGINSKAVNEYLDENKLVIEHKIAAYKQNWLRERQKIDQKTTNAKAQELEKTKAAAFQEIQKAFKENLTYSPNDLENQEWNNQKSKFKETILIRSQKEILKFDKQLVSEYLDLNANQIDQDLNKLYQKWQTEFNEAQTQEAQTIKSATQETAEEIQTVMTLQPEEKPEPKEAAPELKEEAVKIPVEEADIPAEVEEEIIESEKEPEVDEQPQEEPQPESIEEIDQEQSEKIAEEYKIPKNVQSLFDQQKLQHFTKLYSSQEIEKGSERLNQLMETNPRLRTLLQTGNSSENTAFFILTLNKLNEFYFQDFQTALNNNNNQLPELINTLIALIGIDYVPGIFQNRLEDTWKNIQKYLNEQQIKKEETDELIDEEIEEQLKIITKEQAKVDLQPEIEIFEVDIKEPQTPEAIIPEPDTEIEEVTETTTEQEAQEEIIEIEEQPTATPDDFEQSQEEPLPPTEEITEIEDNLEESEAELTTLENTEDNLEEQSDEITLEETEPEQVNFEEQEPTIDQFQETDENSETSEETNQPFIAEEIFSGEMNEMPPFILEQMIQRSLTPENIKTTLEQVELILSNPTEKNALPLFMLLKIMYRMGTFIDLAEFCKNFARFLSDFTGKQISHSLHCPVKLQALFITEPQKLFGELLKQLPKDLENIQHFNFNLSEKSNYLNTTQALIDFEIVIQGQTSTSQHETKLATKDFIENTSVK